MKYEDFSVTIYVVESGSELRKLLLKKFTTGKLQTDQVLILASNMEKGTYIKMREMFNGIKPGEFDLVQLSQKKLTSKSWEKRSRDPQHELAIANIIIPDTKYQMEQRALQNFKFPDPDSSVYVQIEADLIKANIAKNRPERRHTQHFEDKNELIKSSGKIFILSEYLKRATKVDPECSQESLDLEKILIVTHLSLYNIFLGDLLTRLDISY